MQEMSELERQSRELKIKRLIEAGKATRTPQTHGLSATKFYSIYQSAKRRCTNKNSSAWPFYGGKGIKFLWKSFEDFRDDMFCSYQDAVKINGEKDTFIDRIDGNGNYHKENCRWVTGEISYTNKINLHMIAYGGVTKCLNGWSKTVGINSGTLLTRIKRGWTPEESFTIKPNKKNRSLNRTYKGKSNKRIIAELQQQQEKLNDKD